MASSLTLLGEVGREALVKALDRHVDGIAEKRDERVGLRRLLTMLTAHRERQSDDNSLGLVLTDQLHETSEPGLGPDAFDDTDRARNRAGGIGDGDAGARRAVVEGQDLQDRSAEAISLLPIS